ncbi:MAG: hypothetical protein IJL81_06430 [Clostridia bacterium]|nr:hypothetical protein [Clostridia bacterium]
MKKKIVAISLLNYIPVLLSVLLFRFGAPLLWPVFIISQVVLIIINFVLSRKKSELIIYSINLLLSTVIANALLTYLYYHIVSDDAETIMVGELGLFVGAVFVFVLSLIFILFKRNKTE